ncbi:hypothetical protein [Parachlamydia sp. AcF125]|uniref:hypothetical protein n=1 Tax=Parachlamydia sp. AcF125 TaxID=2795736 RepID=UPI001BCA05FB|nr:hypothetical protein [Parachlamydia sp. AcF125]MBS4168407.1 hypothetical protein [Parachlamydia sp. AcF125]
MYHSVEAYNPFGAYNLADAYKPVTHGCADEIDYLTEKSFGKLMGKNFEKNLDYIIAVVVDEKKHLSLYDGCRFARRKVESQGEYNPETAEKISKIFYYCISKRNPMKPQQFLGNQPLNPNSPTQKSCSLRQPSDGEEGFSISELPSDF